MEPEDRVEGVHVYLDQADWSYLEDGRAADAERELRELAEDHPLLFLISMEHFVETGGLNVGVAKRLSYLKSFPGTMWVATEGTTLVKNSADALVDMALRGRERAPLELQLWPLENLSLAELENMVNVARLMRVAYSMGAKAETHARSTRKGMKKRTLQSQEKYVGHFIDGNWGKVRKHLEKKGIGGVRQWPGRLLMWLTSGAFSYAKRKGLWGITGARYDPVFNTWVYMHIDRDIRRNADHLTAIRKVWKDEKQRCSVAPELSCAVSIVESVFWNSARTYSISEEIDPFHAAHAPLVDIFTCDKRNEQPLRRVFRSGGLRTVLLRTKHLFDVIREIRIALGFPN